MHYVQGKTHTCVPVASHECITYCTVPIENICNQKALTIGLYHIAGSLAGIKGKISKKVNEIFIWQFSSRRGYLT